jgi:hypothetical protein
MPHTPGPWIVCTCHGNDAVLSIEQNRNALAGDEPSIIAEVDLCGEGITEEIGEANANLIAASPALLKACEEALSYFAGFTDLTRAEDALIGELGAVIEIAKGNGRAKDHDQ